MRALALATSAALAVLVATGARAADLTGLWATQSSGGVVEISACGEAVCGRLVRSPYLLIDPTLRDRRNRDAALRARPLKGLTILSGFTGGPIAWAEGEVYNPDNGRTYRATLELVGEDRLKVVGCAAGRRCVAQVWSRLAE